MFALPTCSSIAWKILMLKHFVPVLIHCFKLLRWLHTKCWAWHFHTSQHCCCCKCWWSTFMILALLTFRRWIITLAKQACGTTFSSSINFTHWNKELVVFFCSHHYFKSRDILFANFSFDSKKKQHFLIEVYAVVLDTVGWGALLHRGVYNFINFEKSSTLWYHHIQLNFGEFINCEHRSSDSSAATGRENQFKVWFRWGLFVKYIDKTLLVTWIWFFFCNNRPKMKPLFQFDIRGKSLIFQWIVR